MKRVLFILLLLTASRCMAAFSFASVPDNITVCLHGDSLFTDGTSTAPQTGQLLPSYLATYFWAVFPQNTNTAFFNFGRSGSTLNDQITAVAQDSAAAWGFNAVRGIGTNAAYNVGISQTTDNGNWFSNQVFYAQSNMFQSPLVLTNGTANTNEGGWAGTNVVLWYSMGDPPSGTADPSLLFTPQSAWARNNGGTNAGITFGAGAMDAFGIAGPAITNWIGEFGAIGIGQLIITNTTSVPPGDNKAGHFLPSIELGWTLADLNAMGAVTNIAGCVIDFNSATVVSTNQEVVSGLTKTGNSVAFTLHKLRYPIGFDAAGADASGNILTNDSTIWFQINPPDQNAEFDTITVQNLPVGNYDVKIGGELVATLSAATLAGGWNMFTNTVGPIWRTRAEILGQCRDVQYANRISRVVGNGGDGIGVPGYGSLMFSKFPGEHGNSLITDSTVTNYLWGLATNSTHSFAAVRSSAQPQDFQVAIGSRAPGSGAAPFRP